MHMLLVCFFFFHTRVEVIFFSFPSSLKVVVTRVDKATVRLVLVITVNVYYVNYWPRLSTSMDLG